MAQPQVSNHHIAALSLYAIIQGILMFIRFVFGEDALEHEMALQPALQHLRGLRAAYYSTLN